MFSSQSLVTTVQVFTLHALLGQGGGHLDVLFYNIEGMGFAICFYADKGRFKNTKRLFAGPANNTLFAGTILRLTPLKCP